MKIYKEADKRVHQGQDVTFDVVCGMDIATDKARCNSVYHNVKYYFCSHHCKQHFDNTPERYVWEK